MIWGIEFIHISMCIYITAYLGYRDLLLIHTLVETLFRQPPFLSSHQCVLDSVARMLRPLPPALGQSHLPLRIQDLMSLVSK